MLILLWEIMTKPSILQKGTWRFQERYDFHNSIMLAVGFCSHLQRFYGGVFTHLILSDCILNDFRDS